MTCDGGAAGGAEAKAKAKANVVGGGGGGGGGGERGDGEGGEYVRLLEVVEGPDPPELGSKRWLWWMKVVVVCCFLLVAAAAFVVWGLPVVLNEVVVPTLDWERNTFCKPVLAVVLFASLALFPALLLPSSPSMWIAGITFGYGYGFLLIMAGASMGMSLPFFIGSIFRHKIHRWLEKWPKRAALVRLAGEGNWFHQFRAVILIRISPFPYIIFNYAAVATNVRYWPYMCGSLVGIVPDIFIAIYSGILIRNLADMTGGRGFLTLEQIIYDIIGFCIALAATIAITLYAKSALQTLQSEDELV